MTEIIENVAIEKIIYKGLGLAKSSNGKKILIKGNIIPHSIIDVEVIKRKKDFITARMTKVKQYDDTWVDETYRQCDHYDNPLSSKEISATYGCGGCRRQVIPYTKQLLIKQQILDDSFRRINKHLTATNFYPITPSPTDYAYRNKIEISFGFFEEQTKQAGFHIPSRFDQVVDIQHCHLMDQKTNTVIQIIKQILLHDHTLPIYNPKNQTGILRHLVCRRGENTDQLMINLVYADKKMNTQQKNQRSMACQALQNHEQLASLVTTCIITAHTGVSDIVHYDTGYEKLWGPGHIFEKLSRATTQVTFRISPFSFFQTNTGGAEQLFSHVASFLTKQQETILDLYCGTGTIGLSLLKQGIGKFLIGIEIVEQAVNDAWDNATINGLADQVYFAKGKAETLFRLDKTIQQHLSNITTIIVDPPRDGLHPKVVKFLNQLKTQYNFSLIYISCNPNTLARDLQGLFAGGYQCSTIQPVDMFPQTYHIETIAVLK